MSEPNSIAHQRRSIWLGAGLIALTSLIVSSPGLGGGWIQDDVNMVDNPHYRHASDLLAVAWQHSGVYAPTAGSSGPGAMSETYRPLTMLTLVATHVLSATPLPHHVLGWALHALAGWLLFLALRRAYPRDEALPVHAAIAALFLLHPVGVESYVWINGRSDLVAGVCLAGLLAIFATAPRVTPRHALAIFLLVLLGSASKEPFVPAALVSAFALAAWPVSPGLAAAARGRRLLFEFVPSLAGVALYAVVRFSVLPPTSGSLAGAGNPFAKATGWLFLPKMYAIASHALLSLRAANMQSLNWDLVRELGTTEWLCAGLAAAALIGLSVARDWRALALTVAAAAGLAPVALVVFAFWLGFDRYLYMPLILLLFAAAPYLERGFLALTAISPRLASLVPAAVLAIAAFNTFVASRAYRDQATWLETLAEERPEDPSVAVVVAMEVGQPHVLRERLPPPPWPSAILERAVKIANADGDIDLANKLAEYGLRSYGENPAIVALAFRQRYDHRSQRAALDLLPALSRSSTICRGVRQQLGVWAAQGNSAERDSLAAAAKQLACPP